MKIEKISAVTMKVRNMERSIHFYREILGLETLYIAPGFSSFHAGESIMNLELGTPVQGWGRIVLYVDDVDEVWAYLKKKGYHAEEPKDAQWGERYFHLDDPDGHELSFAKPIKRKG